MTDKRRFIEQLPYRLRTEDLSKFFSSTVDHVFQPGSAEPISGYIGRLPSYYDPDRDFYIQEPNLARTLRQLEPVMVTTSESAIATALFYDDLINYIDSQGGITTDLNRLFDTEYYSWAPPVDLGKLTSPQNYYWFGDDPIALPGLLLTAPITPYFGNNVRSTFDLPPPVAGLTTDDETIAVWVDGLPASILSHTTTTVTISAAPVTGAVVEVYRYGDLAKVITGKETFDPSAFVWPTHVFKAGGNSATFSIPKTFTALDSISNYVAVSGDVSVFVNDIELTPSQYSNVAGYVTLDFSPSNGSIVRVVRYRATATNMTALSNGMRVVLNDATVRAPGFEIANYETDPWDNVANTSFIVDGVGSSIMLSSHDFIPHPDPLYTVIDRRSRDGNPWSRTNLWVHREAFEWAHVLFSDRVAKRPIIEFIADLQLYQYGRRYMGRVDRVLTGPGAAQNPFDTSGFDLTGFEFGTLDSAAQINGQPDGSVLVDDSMMLEIGNRVLLRNTVPGRDDLSHTIVRVVEAINSNGDIVMALEPETGIEQGDVVTVGATAVAYYLEGDTWLPAQNISSGAAPLFDLYDRNRDALDDSGFYPSSTFAGSKIFSYAIRASGTADPYIGVPLTHDSLGQIVFENLLITQSITYGMDSTAITGMRFYRVLAADPADDVYASDWHRIAEPLILLEQSIPQNLQANPDNEQIGLISKNEWTEHFRAIIENQDGFTGDAFGVNNWHNTARNLAASGTDQLKILQHRSPLLKTMLLASNKGYDFFDTTRYVENEYSRFRSRFTNSVVQAYKDGLIGDNDSAATIVRMILKSLKTNKTIDFPFALNLLGDTTGTETFFIPPTATAIGVTPACAPGLETDSSFGFPMTMLRGHDGSRTPLFSDTVFFVGDGTTKDFVLDNEPNGPVTVTVDNVAVAPSVAGKIVSLSSAPVEGTSIRIAISDIRDRAMLALEQAIYQTIPALFRSDNDGSDTYRGFEIDTWMEGRFRPAGDYGYTRAEVSRLFSPMFLLWAQKQGLEYRTNDAYEPSDPFTWNYSTSQDRYGDSVPGNWRGIYHWYFDTARPHIAPWEMLGFAQKPTWWDNTYGPAPYTNTNTTMWHDLRDGRIAQGPRAGIDARYVRADLMDVLPVDEFGDLLDPMAAGIIPTAPLLFQAEREWTVGDCGPVEHLWRNSTSFPFALAMVSFLMKPARFVEATWDPINTREIGDQWLYLVTGNRPRNAELTVHGERDSAGTRQPKIGIQEWISERMISLGQDPTTFGTNVRSLGVRLGHKVAGFLKSDNLRVQADNFGLVPEEDTTILLYTSPSYRRDFYSGVIVEWSGTGWRVFGYDAQNPAFTVLDNDTSGQRGIVSISTAPEVIVVEWKPNVHYKSAMLVNYKGSIYQANSAHTSTNIFEQSFWTARPDMRLPEAPRVTRYLHGNGLTSTIPYGTEFDTYQEVADFLFSYERYLLSRGWEFESGDESGPFDWSRAMREFLEWAGMQWEPGNFIALSPGAAGLSYKTDHGMIYSLEQAFNGSYGLVDRAGLPIDARDTFVTRIDGEVTVRSRDNNLYGVRLNVGEVEHALIFSNETIFGDIIYKPIYDLRQPRFRLSGHRATNWTGRFDAPGYIITDNGIVANFDRAAEDIRTAFDIEGAGDKNLRDHARHLVGYESRSYLRDLLLSETQQFEFYQGMIQQKGSPSVFDKMLRSQFIEQERNLKFLEEWAFKVSSYGGLDVTKRYSFNLSQSNIARNPQLVRFRSTETPDTADGVHNVAKSTMIAGSEDLPNIFKTRTSYARLQGDLPTAGYPRLDEVSYTSFDLNTLTSLYVLAAAANGGRAFAHGDRMWVYDGNNHDWDVLRSSNLTTDATPNRVLRIEVSTDGSYSGARVVLEQEHGLTLADRGKLIVLDGETRTKADLSGVQRIFDVGDDWIELELGATNGYRWIEVDGDGADALETATDPENAPIARALQSVRFATIDDLNDATWFVPTVGELAYVDTDPSLQSDVRWVVRQYANGNWNTVYRVQPLKVDSQSIVGSAVYDTVSQITRTRLLSEPLILDRLTVIDPVGGIIPGEAARELDYLIEYDPASYNRGDASGVGIWGIERAGQLWWDLSTVRFINPETDQPVGSARIDAENRYRVENWGKIAPGTQIDVYEWTRSLTPPGQYTGEGVVYRSANPNWSEVVEYDTGLGRNVTVYYFWVKGITQVSRLAQDRKLDAVTVSRIIENSTSIDLPWIAATFTDGMMIGGVSQMLTESSVLQIDVRRIDSDTPVHTEWTLMRPEDSRSQPSDEMWAKMIDSLAGADRFKRLVPDPNLNSEASQGILVRPRQSLFGGSPDQRETLRLARESMIGMLNIIFAREDVVRQRVAPIQTLLALYDHFPSRTRSDVDDQIVLAWSGQDEFECGLPTKFEFDFEVFSYDERNDLLLSPAFDAARTAGTKVRVLINGLEADVPFWSVWSYDPANDSYDTDVVARFNHADELFELAPAYDVMVADRTARNALTGLSVGDVVYVEADSAASAFWTLWRYNPTGDGADSQGFVLLRAQDYRLSDFIDIVDWYAEGYSAANPPVVSFPTKFARDAAFGTTPVSAFVRIEDDGDDAPYSGWMWTVFADGVWTTVAREKRTISINSAMFSRLEEDAATTTYALSVPTTPTLGSDWVDTQVAKHDLNNIVKRDGALEVRALLSNLISSVLTEDETNELFFSLVHFAHAHFDQINWAFKTSFLYIGGYNEALDQTPIQSSDNTNSLLSYIEEVKPYRVKTRDFARGLAPPVETANVVTTDFDKPVYYDTQLGHYRRLDPNNTVDQAIMTSGMWKNWYANYLKNGYDLDTYSASTWNPIRRLKTTISFDRVDGWIKPNETVPFFTGNAGQRIEDSYVPSFPGQVEKNLKALMKLDFKGIISDGQDMSGDVLPNDSLIDGNGSVVYNINPTINGVSTLGLNDPKTAENRPEELVFLGHQDYVSFNVHSTGRPGAPYQVSKVFNVSFATGNTITLSYADLAQSNEGVAVFRDGVRAEPSTANNIRDYVIDQFKRNITVNLHHDDGSRVNRVSVHVFGVGGTTRMLEQRFYTFGPGDSQTLTVSGQPAGTALIEAYVNGEIVGSSANFALDPAPVTLSVTLHNGDDVLLNVREATGTQATPEILVLTEEFGYAADGIWQISDWESTRLDAHAMAVVELDGVRLTPPETKYLRVGSGFRWALIDHLPTTGSDYDLVAYDDGEYDVATADRLLWNIYVGEDEYLGDVPDVSGLFDNPTDVVNAGTFGADRFAYWNNYIICVDPEVITDEVVIVINEGHDYTISRDGVLTLLNPPADNGENRVRVTLFTKPDAVGIETWTYKGRNDGSYPIYRPYGGEYLWLTVNGKKMVYGVDFNITTDSDIGDYDSVSGFDSTEWDNDNSFSSTAGNWDLDQWDVAEDEYDTLPVPEPIIQFAPGHLLDDDIVITVFKNPPMKLPSKFLVASTVPGKSIMMPLGDGQFSMDGGWEYLWVRNGHTGKLANSISDDDTSITVSLPDYSLEIYDEPWFVHPHSDAPGIAWIDGERIEYSHIVETPGQVVLSGLVRSSKGTGIKDHAAGSTIIAAVKTFEPRNSAL